MSPALPAPRLVIAVAAGGALGAVLRFGLTEVFPASTDGFPWAVFVVNVAGSFALALLPALSAVRRRPTLVAGLGPGVLGGFTTLSAYSEQSRALLAAGHTGLAASYLLGTLGACLLAVVLAERWSSP